MNNLEIVFINEFFENMVLMELILYIEEKYIILIEIELLINSL